MTRVALLAFCGLLGACAGTPARLQMTYAEDLYALDDGGAAAYEPGCTDRITLLRLTPQERERIGSTAERSGFFDWPRDLRELPPEPAPDAGLAAIQPASACDEGKLELSRHGRRHSVHWTCNTAAQLNQEPAAAPRQIRPLLDAIRQSFAAHAEFTAAGSNACTYQ